MTEHRLSYDEVADLYDQVRPDYPTQLVDDVLSLSRIRAHGKILEVGCGTGQATRLFAAHNLRMLCLEPGPNLARLAARNCSVFPDVEIQNISFEDWVVRRASFQLLISAQAFHWVSPEIRYAKAAQALRKAGAIALFWNTPREGDSAVHHAIQRAYVTHAPGLAARLPGRRPVLTGTPPEDDLDASGLFGTVFMSRYPWHAQYDAAHYVKLLETQSDHRMLPNPQRTDLLAAVGETIEKFGGSIAVDYVTRLYVAKRKD